MDTIPGNRVKVYVVEVKVEVVWMDGVSTENLALSIGERSEMKPMLLPHHHLKEFQSLGYIQDLLLLDL